METTHLNNPERTRHIRVTTSSPFAQTCPRLKYERLNLRDSYEFVENGHGKSSKSLMISRGRRGIFHISSTSG